NQAWTTNDCRSRAVSRLMSGGKTSSDVSGACAPATPAETARATAARNVLKIAITESLGTSVLLRLDFPRSLARLGRLLAFLLLQPQFLPPAPPLSPARGG